MKEVFILTKKEDVRESCFDNPNVITLPKLIENKQLVNVNPRLNGDIVTVIRRLNEDIFSAPDGDIRRSIIRRYEELYDCSIQIMNSPGNNYSSPFGGYDIIVSENNGLIQGDLIYRGSKKNMDVFRIKKIINWDNKTLFNLREVLNCFNLDDDGCYEVSTNIHVHHFPRGNELEIYSRYDDSLAAILGQDKFKVKKEIDGKIWYREEAIGQVEVDSKFSMEGVNRQRELLYALVHKVYGADIGKSGREFIQNGSTNRY